MTRKNGFGTIATPERQAPISALVKRPALVGAAMLVAGCTMHAGSESEDVVDSATESEVSIFEHTVIESQRSAEGGIETIVFDAEHRAVLARLSYSAQTGLTRVEEPSSDEQGERDAAAGDKTLETGFSVDSLAVYNEGVNRAWERIMSIRSGQVAYGECGSGWSEWVVPDGWWGSCCTTHDQCYGVGGDQQSKDACDRALRDCINNVWGPGNTYYGAVQTFGGSYFNYWQSSCSGWYGYDPSCGGS